MSQRLSGDAPYFRTVPSSPSNEDDGLADEDDPTDNPSPTSQQQKAQIVVEDDEETILRRRLLEKKLEKEKTKAVSLTKEPRDGGGAQQRTKESDREHQKEKPRRQKIVWEKEKESSKSSRYGGQTAVDKHGQRSQSQTNDMMPSSSTSSALHRRRDEGATVSAHEHRQHRHRRRDDEPLQQQHQQREGTTTMALSREHHHKHRHRKEPSSETGTGGGGEHRKDRQSATTVVADGKDRSGTISSTTSTVADDEQRVRTTTKTMTTTTTTTTERDEPQVVDEATATTTTRKRRHHQVEGVTGEQQTEAAAAAEAQPTAMSVEIGSGDQQQQQREEGEEEGEEIEEGEEGGGDGSNEGKKRAKRGEEVPKRRREKRKKFSKFESSPEEEEEEEEEQEEDNDEEEEEKVVEDDEEELLVSDGDEEEDERGRRQIGIGGGGGGGSEQKQTQLQQQQQRQCAAAMNEQELIMEECFGMDERHFRSRAGTVDTEVNGATTNGEEEDEGMDIGDELAENKEFDQLTDEDKALLSPEMLSQKEDKYQRRLVSLLPVYYPGISGCRSVAEYECLNKISEGTFGVVYRAQNKRTDEIVALKRLKMEKEHQGFPITSLREINMLLKCGAHPNIVNVREVVVGSSMDKIYLVMDFVEHDVKALIELMKSRGKKWTIPQVKTLIRQLIAGVLYMHDQYVIHRDLKTSNLLLSHQGILKIGDFGLAREFGDPIKPYTPVVVTLWYRAPELLLGTKLYSTPVDMWSVGCIFAEFLKLEPLFPGRTEIDQMQKIFKEVGTPNEQIWPGCMELPGMKTGVFADTPYNQLRKKFAAELPDDDGFELLNKLLTLNPSKRLDAETAVVSKWFNNDPKPAHPSTFPTWPAKSEQNRRPLKDVLRIAAEVGGRAPQQPPPRPTGGFTLRFDAPKF